MREKIVRQGSLVPRIDHPHARELELISEALDALPGIVDAVHSDLTRHLKDPSKGREGLTAERVLRLLVLKQLKGFSYEQLRFELASSWVYQWFCRWDPNLRVPKRTTLQRNIRCIRPETLETTNRALVKYAVEQRIEMGRKVRTDCTVEETNIHDPTDSRLLWDCVRVLARLMHKAKKLVASVTFTDHTRVAKRRSIAILHAGSIAKRTPLYKDLLKVTRKTTAYVEPVLQALSHFGGGMVQMARACELAQQLRHYRQLALQVLDQTERRVLRGESVPASDKIVSIFEPHTDIIRKDRRETHYGHKLCLTTGASGLVLDVQVLHGNPSDSTLALDAIQRLEPVLGQLPTQVSFDGGFASKQNLDDIKALGVRDVAFHKKRGLAISDMAKSTGIYRMLKRFRAGVESTMSFLKRCFGLDRCTWRGWDSFKAYTLASVLAHNLLFVARHALG